MRLKEEIMMINLTGKIVFVKTQEEYLSVLKMAKLQGCLLYTSDAADEGMAV